MTVQEAWEKILNITSTYEQGASDKLKDDPYYREEVMLITSALDNFTSYKTSYEMLAEAHNEVLEKLQDQESDNKCYKIIKEKVVDIPVLLKAFNCYVYNQFHFSTSKDLTSTEFELLKRELTR